jgi:hypothetical protein
MMQMRAAQGRDDGNTPLANETDRMSVSALVDDCGSITKEVARIYIYISASGLVDGEQHTHRWTGR